MASFFSQLLSISLTGAGGALMVMALRLFLKKAPGSARCCCGLSWPCGCCAPSLWSFPLRWPHPLGLHRKEKRP